MYSFHSSAEEKNKLLHVLTEYGVETTVDRSAKKARIQQWIQNSIIREEDEEPVGEENDFSTTYERFVPEYGTASSTTGDAPSSK